MSKSNVLSIFVITILSNLLFYSVFAIERQALQSNRFEMLSGIRKKNTAGDAWDSKYSTANYIYGKNPAKFLAENYYYIPEGSSVLDMGMGEGRNAVFLARKGYNVTGIDVSSVAVKKARLLAQEFGVRFNSVVASLNDYAIAPESFDAIICFYYVDRSLHSKMWEWLKPGGILVYESHTDLQKTLKGSEKYDSNYLLRPGELLSLFKGYKILKYEEPLHLSEFTSSIILQKPKKK